MNSLFAEAARLNVTIESGNLPASERSRYIPSQRRVIVATGLSPLTAAEAVAVGLSHAEHNDIAATAANQARAHCVARRRFAGAYAMASLVVDAITGRTAAATIPTGRAA